MIVSFHDQQFAFKGWKPSLGKVFDRTFSFDSETTLIDDQHPDQVPKYVLGAAFGGQNGYFITRETVEPFFRAHDHLRFVFHNAAFDLAVIKAVAPELDIYERVDRNLVWDTQLLHRLLVLGLHGHTATGRGESTLERCVQEYLGIDLPKDIVDSRGKPVRLSYGQWLNRSPGEIEPVYLEYLAMDAIATRLVYRELRRRHKELLERSRKAWGFVSEDWLTKQVAAWGPQTHHVQLRASIVLRSITANGMHLDANRREELARSLAGLQAEKKKMLARHGYLVDQPGSGKALQAILQRLERDHHGLSFPRTDTGKFATSREVLQDLVGTVPFVQLLLEHREIDKLLGSFVNKLAKPVVHPSFNVLALTGRTTSFGDINAQNLPRDDRVRSCFVPSSGHVFIDLDYKAVELATLAQACIGQFGLDSAMADAINSGQDLHTVVAAHFTGKPESEVSAEERRYAKAINFGKPGGMGDAALKAYARTSYGVELNDGQAAALSAAWLDRFPEMRVFLGDDSDLGEDLARFLDLTPLSHSEHTGDDRFLRHPENAGCVTLPHTILGWMCRRAMGETRPTTKGGHPYSPADLDYFWSRVAAHVDQLPASLRPAVAARQASPSLQKAICRLVAGLDVITLTGRLRARADYCARHNTVFQGLAADGAELALWKVWRAGYRIVNFVHDQLLVEVPANSDLRHHAETLQRLMIAGMRAVVPDVRIDVEFAAMDRWYKSAEAVFDSSGKKLRLWRPPVATKVPASVEQRPPKRSAVNVGRPAA